MNRYDDATRGTFQSEDRAKQLVSFDGFKFNGRNGKANVTPTDIDGLIQLDNEDCFIFFELKYSGGVAAGQGCALEKLVDAVASGGKDCVLFVATHNTKAPKTIIAKDAIVNSLYWRGKWLQSSKGFNLLYAINSYIRFINYERREAYKVVVSKEFT